MSRCKFGRTGPGFPSTGGGNFRYARLGKRLGIFPALPSPSRRARPSRGRGNEASCNHSGMADRNPGRDPPAGFAKWHTRAHPPARRIESPQLWDRPWQRDLWVLCLERDRIVQPNPVPAHPPQASPQPLACLPPLGATCIGRSVRSLWRLLPTGILLGTRQTRRAHAQGPSRVDRAFLPRLVPAPTRRIVRRCGGRRFGGCAVEVSRLWRSTSSLCGAASRQRSLSGGPTSNRFEPLSPKTS